MHTTEPVVLAAGDVRLTLDRFALTSNNISYALSGDFLDYWGFFPAEDGWGRLPAMGYGIVSESANPDIAVGGRYFGFFPLAVNTLCKHNLPAADLLMQERIEKNTPWHIAPLTVLLIQQAKTTTPFSYSVDCS